MSELFTWLWQATALALVSAAVLRACPRLNAASRHAIWWAVLVAILALPWIPRIGTSPVVPSASSEIVSPSASAPLVLPSAPDWLVGIGIGAWLGFVLLGLVRIGRSVALIARLKREGEAMPEPRQRALRLWNAARRSGRPVALLVSDRVRTACAVGLGRGAIVLPRTLADALDDDTLDQVVMHEHAHLERRDDAWRLVQAVVEAVAGWHPAVRVATRHIDLEREAACDDRVVERTGAADRYASCLAETAALASSAWATGDPALLPGAVGGSSVLRLRVVRLLEPGRRRTPRVARRAMMASVAALAMAGGLSSRMGPLVAFAEAGAEADVVEARAIQLSLAGDWAGTAEGARPPTTPPVTDVPSARRTDVQARAIARSPISAPAAPEPERLAGDSTAEPAVTALPARALQVPYEAPSDAPGVGPAAADGASNGSAPTPWSAAADAGTAIGRATGRGGVAVGVGAKKAGTAVAGFFSRSGRAARGGR